MPGVGGRAGWSSAGAGNPVAICQLLQKAVAEVGRAAMVHRGPLLLVPYATTLLRL